MELDPSNPFHHTMYGMVLLFAQRFEDAIQHLRQSLGMLPTNVLAQLGLAGSYASLGDGTAAIEHLAEHFEVLGDTEITAALRSASTSGHVTLGFQRAGEVLESRTRTTFVKPMHGVIMFDNAGNLDRAFAWAEKAFELRDHDMTYFAVAPWSPALRADSRYARMLERMRLLPEPAVGGAKGASARR